MGTVFSGKGEDHSNSNCDQDEVQIPVAQVVEKDKGERLLSAAEIHERSKENAKRTAHKVVLYVYREHMPRAIEDSWTGMSVMFEKETADKYCLLSEHVRDAVSKELTELGHYVQWNIRPKKHPDPAEEFDAYMKKWYKNMAYRDVELCFTWIR